MSLEAKIEQLTGTITALTEVLKQTVANQERLVAGQQAAIDKIEAGKADKPATRTRRSKKEEEPAEDKGNDEPADTASGADDAKTASEVPSGAEIFEHVKGMLGKLKDKDAKRHAAVGSTLVAAVKDVFGGKKLPELTDEDDRKKAWFFVRRLEAGKDVDLSAEYDFDGDPAQDVEGGEGDFDDLG